MRYTAVQQGRKEKEKKEGKLTARVEVSRQLHCTGPGTGVCSTTTHNKRPQMKRYSKDKQCFIKSGNLTPADSDCAAGETYIPGGDGGHGGVLVAEPHSVVVGDLPGGHEGGTVIRQQPLII